jgi:hypothetical protein
VLESPIKGKQEVPGSPTSENSSNNNSLNITPSIADAAPSQSPTLSSSSSTSSSPTSSSSTSPQGTITSGVCNQREAGRKRIVTYFILQLPTVDDASAIADILHNKT